MKLKEGDLVRGKITGDAYIVVKVDGELALFPCRKQGPQSRPAIPIFFLHFKNPPSLTRIA
jgi:hypothetical protein